MSAVIPDPALTDWVPLWSLGAPSGMVMIEEKILSADAASMEFVNIPQTYKHLLLVGMVKGAAGSGGQVWLRYNGNSSSIYRWGSGYMTGAVVLQAEGVGSDSKVVISPGGAAAMHMIDCSIPYYAQAVLAEKYAMNRIWNDTVYGGWAGGEWQSSAAIQWITLMLNSGNIAAGSRVTLYGLTDVGNPPSTAVPVGGALGYVDRSTTFSSSGAPVESAAQTWLDFGAIDFGTPAPLVYVECFLPMWNRIGTGHGVNLWRGSTDTGRLAYSSEASGPVYQGDRYARSDAFTPPNGSSTYSLRSWGAGAHTIEAGPGGAGAYRKAWARIVRAA